MTGQEMYERYRAAMNRRGGKRGNHPEPRWAALKPWIKSVWQEAAGEKVTGR